MNEQLAALLLLANAQGQTVSAEDNSDWMADPDGSITIAIGEMSTNGTWITLNADGTYTLEAIAP